MEVIGKSYGCYVLIVSFIAHLSLIDKNMKVNNFLCSTIDFVSKNDVVAACGWQVHPMRLLKYQLTTWNFQVGNTPNLGPCPGLLMLRHLKSCHRNKFSNQTCC